jgi:hypothetical protein
LMSKVTNTRPRSFGIEGINPIVAGAMARD